MSILLYGCTIWTLTKRLEKKLDSNYSRMLRAILNRSWRQHPTKQQLYGHLPPTTKTVRIRRTIHAGHCWRSRDELMSDVLLWTPSHGWAKAGRPARTYIQRLREDTDYSPEDLPIGWGKDREDQGYPRRWYDMMMMMMMCQDLYSFCASLLNSLITRTILSSQSPHNLHLVFCGVYSILVLV